MKILRLSAVAGVLSLCAVAGAQEIRINEIMQSNVHGLMVESDFPDSWIELYNPGNKQADLSGYGIGVKEKFSKAYILPEGSVIPAKGYMLIYCDKEENGLHTDFRLESGKGSVFVFSPDGEVVTSLDHPKMPAPDVSYGYVEDGVYSYYLKSTPGEVNSGATSNKVLPNPVFSCGGGLVEKMKLKVSIPTDVELPADTKLCVTTDGSDPTIENACKGHTMVINIDKSTPVRARLISDSMLSPASVGNTYLILDEKPTLPVVTLMGNPDYFYDEKIGILMGSESDLPMPNYRQEWRRPVIVEFYDADGHESAFNQLGEIELQGNTSLIYPQKSIKVYANKRFGEKRFNYTLWPEEKPNVTEPQSFSLRNAGQAFNLDHLRDSFFQRLFGPTTDGHLDWQSYRPVLSFINGKPYGLIDLRERSNDTYIESNYPDLEDFIMVENWWENKAGDMQEYYRVRRMWLNTECTYDELDEVIDMDSFAAITIANAFSFNIDTPSLNTIMWTPSANSKWRWLLKDMDWTMKTNLVDNDYISYLKNEENEEFLSNYKNKSNIELYQRCVDFPQFINLLATRFVAYYGDFLRPERTLKLFNDMFDEISHDYYLLAELYGFDPRAGSINEEVREFLRERGMYMFKNLQARFGFGDLLDLEFENPKHLISLNGHKIVNDDFKGKAFSGRALAFSADEPGRWIFTMENSDGSVSRTAITGDSVEFTPCTPGALLNVQFIDKDSGIEYAGDDFNIESVYYTLEGIKLPSRPAQRGIYIKVSGGNAEKILVP